MNLNILSSICICILLLSTNLPSQCNLVAEATPFNNKKNLHTTLRTKPSKGKNEAKHLPVAPTFNDMIYFETHGRDDIRQWDSQFLKGTHTMKVDFNFQIGTACQGQINLPPGYNYSRGCLLLAHWFGGNAIHNHYNTSYDIISYFANPSTQSLLSRIAAEEMVVSNAPTRSPVIIQICLKNPPPYSCDGPNINSNSSVEALLFVNLLEEFHMLLQPILRNNYNQTTPLYINNSFHNPPLDRVGLGNLIFVIDSFSYLNRECLAHRFWPWASTYVGGDQPALSNDDGYDLFQMVNLLDLDLRWNWLGVGNASAPVGANILGAATPSDERDQFFFPFFKWDPTFTNATSDYLRQTYPMIAYEPSDESEILWWYETYAHYGYTHPGGVFIAYNPDPSNFHTYTAAATGRYSHFPFGSNNSLTPVTSYMELFIPSAENLKIFDPAELHALHKSEADNQTLSGYLFTATLLIADPTALEFTLHQRMPRETFQMLTTVTLSGVGAQLLGGRLSSVQFLPSEAHSITTSSIVTGEIIVTGSTAILLQFEVSLNFQGQTQSFESLSVKLNRTITVTGNFGPRTQMSFAWLSVPLQPSADGSSSFASYYPAVATYCADSKEITLSALDPTTYQIINDVQEWNLIGQPSIVAKAVAPFGGGWSFALGFFQNETVKEVRMVLSWSLDRNVYTVVGVRDIHASEALMMYTSPAHLGIGAAPSHSFDVFSSLASSPNYQQRNTGTHILITYGESFCYNTENVDDDSLEFFGMMICDVQDWPYFELSQCPVQNYVFGRFEDYMAEVVVYGGSLKNHARQHQEELFHHRPDARILALVSGIENATAERLEIAENLNKLLSKLSKNKDSHLADSDDTALLLPPPMVASSNDNKDLRTLLHAAKQSLADTQSRYALKDDSNYQMPVSYRMPMTPLNGFATACSPTLLMGSFDLFSNSSALLLPKVDGLDIDIREGGFLAAVVGTSNSQPTLSECGNPLPHGGMALLDSFPLFGFFNRRPTLF